MLQRNLVHKNIVRMYYVFVEKNATYIVLGFVPCGSVMDLMKRRREEKKSLKMCEIWYFFTQMIVGLQHIHNNNFCHNDVKPQNMLITPERVLKISDFGECEELKLFDLEETLKPKSVPHGTILFFSPQMASGEKSSRIKSDIWAAGVSLYCMLTDGKYPFHDENIMQLLNKIEKGDFEIPSLKDEDLRDLLGKILEKDEGARWTTEKILQHNWIKKNEEYYTKQIQILNHKEPLVNKWKTFSILPYVAKFHSDEEEKQSEEEKSEEAPKVNVW